MRRRDAWAPVMPLIARAPPPPAGRILAGPGVRLTSTAPTYAAPPAFQAPALVPPHSVIRSPRPRSSASLRIAIMCRALGRTPLLPPTPYGVWIRPKTAGDLRPRQARLLLQPLQALWEVVGDVVGFSLVEYALSRHSAGPFAGLPDPHLRERPVHTSAGGRREMPPSQPLPCSEGARPGGLTAPPGHPCMRPAMLSAACRS